jgi:hypothetical protein
MGEGKMIMKLANPMAYPLHEIADQIFKLNHTLQRHNLQPIAGIVMANKEELTKLLSLADGRGLITSQATGKTEINGTAIYTPYNIKREWPL